MNLKISSLPCFVRGNLGQTQLRASWVRTLLQFVCLLKVSSWWKQSEWLTWSALTVVIPLTKNNWFSYASYLVEKGEPSKSKWLPDPCLETHFQSTSSVSRYSAQLCAPGNCGGFCSSYRCPHWCRQHVMCKFLYLTIRIKVLIHGVYSLPGYSKLHIYSFHPYNHSNRQIILLSSFLQIGKLNPRGTCPSPIAIHGQCRDSDPHRNLCTSALCKMFLTVTVWDRGYFCLLDRKLRHREFSPENFGFKVNKSSLWVSRIPGYSFFSLLQWNQT